jgi:hypothetical protein
MLQEYASFVPKEDIIFPVDGCIQNFLGFADEE